MGWDSDGGDHARVPGSGSPWLEASGQGWTGGLLRSGGPGEENPRPPSAERAVRRAAATAQPAAPCTPAAAQPTEPGLPLVQEREPDLLEPPSLPDWACSMQTPGPGCGGGRPPVLPGVCAASLPSSALCWSGRLCAAGKATLGRDSPAGAGTFSPQGLSQENTDAGPATSAWPASPGKRRPRFISEGRLRRRAKGETKMHRLRSTEAPVLLVQTWWKPLGSSFF